MRKPVLIGGGLGLLLLALIAAFLWMNRKQPETAATVAPYRVTNPRIASSVPTSPAAAMAPSGGQSNAQADTSKQERRRRLAEVRAEFRALSAQGAQASPQKMRALVDELEAVSPPGFAPRYFQALRNMLDASTKVQALNTELQVSLKSKAPQDVVRQEALLEQMRTLGQQVAQEAQNLQTYAPSPLPRPKSP